jgi:transcriptional regulator with XRE-family HTH domain
VVKVKELRIKYGLSQQELADKTGIPKGRINNWEQGSGQPKAKDSTILTQFFARLEMKESQNESIKKEHEIEEIRLLIKNIDRIGNTNEYLLNRVKELEDQIRSRK